MTERVLINTDYAQAQLARSWRNLLAHPSDRAERKTKSWIQAISGMLAGVIQVGSSTPVKGYPLWVTLEVLHGGFASGNALSGGEVRPHERELFEKYDCSDRGALNRFFLSEPGQAVLAEALESGAYRIRVPEEGAHLSLYALLESGMGEPAAQVLEQLLPFFSDLRFYPEFLAEPPLEAPANTAHRWSVERLKERLEAYKAPLEIRRMKESLREWRPFYEELLELTRETYAEGWPFQDYPEGWAERATQACGRLQHRLEGACACHFPQRADSNLRRLATIVKRASVAPEELTGRQVGLARVIIADSETRWGTLGSRQREERLQGREEAFSELSPEQAVPILLGRLERLCPNLGISEPEVVLQPIEGQAVPEVLAEKVRQARQATPKELIEQGLVGSAEVMGSLVPQLTSRLIRQGYPELTTAVLIQRQYEAFRNRRSLLLLNMASQTNFTALPWVAAFPQDGASQTEPALELAREVVALAWSQFPQTCLPNPFLREVNTLLTRAGSQLRLVEELAADIFTGKFSPKFVELARRTAELAQGSLYARYYALPVERPPGSAKALLQLCRERCQERLKGASWVAANGMILEEQQILTSANLFPLYDTLKPPIQAAQNAAEILEWVVREFQTELERHYLRMLRLKRVAYAWRQLLFFLSVAEPAQAREVLERCPATEHLGLRETIEDLRSCASGAQSTASLRGWVSGGHALMG